MVATIPAPLSGKVAIVTGASRGIGAAIAQGLARRGCAAVAITYASNQAAAEQSLSNIAKANPNVKTAAIKADLLDPNFGQDVVSKALQQLEVEHLDIVVSNAAYADLKYIQPIESSTKEAFDSLLTANTWAPMRLALAALPHLRKGGRIINISSVASRMANFDPTMVYGASKAALDSLTRSLAAHFAPSLNITINSVSVGPVNTDPMREAMEKLPAMRAKIETAASAAKRIGEVDDIEGIVSFLCTDDARWRNVKHRPFDTDSLTFCKINGNCVPANGGGMLELQG